MAMKFALRMVKSFPCRGMRTAAPRGVRRCGLQPVVNKIGFNQVDTPFVQYGTACRGLFSVYRVGGKYAFDRRQAAGVEQDRAAAEIASDPVAGKNGVHAGNAAGIEPYGIFGAARIVQAVVCYVDIDQGNAAGGGVDHGGTGGERPFGIAIVEAAADEVAVKFFDESPVIKDALSESRAGGVVDEVGVNFVDRSVVDQGNAGLSSLLCRRPLKTAASSFRLPSFSLRERLKMLSAGRRVQS